MNSRPLAVRKELEWISLERWICGRWTLPTTNIIAVGYKVNSERAVQFRKWATHVIKEYTIKAYVMDDERIKSGGSMLTEKYFEEQLQRIREPR